MNELRIFYNDRYIASIQVEEVPSLVEVVDSFIGDDAAYLYLQGLQLTGDSDV